MTDLNNPMTEQELEVLHGISERAVVQTAVEAAAGQYISVPATATTVDVYRYDGMRWRKDKGQRLRNRFMPRIVRAYQQHIADEVASGKFDERECAAMRAFSMSLDGLARFDRIVNGVRVELMDDETVLDPASAPDPDERSGKWLFNTRSGTYDLMLDELRPHDPADMLTQVAPVYYDPTATCPKFDAFLAEILPDKEVADFVLELFAYALNASMEQPVFPIFHGKGANGKSTLTEVMFGIFGTGYTGNGQGDLFEAKHMPSSGPSPERMAMKNKRVVFAKETTEGMTLNAQMVKEFTSVEVVSGRHLYSDPEEFNPTHTAFLVTNHMPTIEGSDDGIWRRVLEIPFKTQIPYKRQRRGYPEELLTESSGIFNRLLAAHRRWRERGMQLDIPEAVRLATDTYRADSDPVLEFVDDTFDFTDLRARMTSAAIYRQYEKFMERAGERPDSMTKFIPWLRREKDLRKYNHKGARGLEGIKMKYGDGDDPTPHNTPTPPEPTKSPIPDRTGGEPSVPPSMYVDLETTGLNPGLDRVRLVTIALSGEDTQVYDVFDEGDRRLVLDVLRFNTDRTFVAHNAAFDLAFLERDLGYTHAGPVFCTMTAAQIENAGYAIPEPAPKYIERYFKNGNPKMKSDRPFSLRSVAFRELGQLMDKGMQRSDWSAEELTDEQLEYAKVDVDVLPSLHRVLARKIADVGTVELDMDNVKVSARLYGRGVNFDREAWLGLAGKHAIEVDRIDAQLDEIAEAEGMGAGAHNWNGPAAKREIARAVGVELPDAQADTIKLHRDEHPAIELLAERTEHFKKATTYGIGFVDKYVDESGRVRSSYKPVGAATGRYSSSGPNLQNIPRDDEYRRCFIPDEGVFVIADFSQIEVRYIAAVSGDEALQAALATGDVYTETARKVMGVEDVSKAERQKAKAIVLGFQYGMGVDKFKDYARDTFGVVMTRDEAAEYKRRFFEAYPTLKKWQRETGDYFDWDVADKDKVSMSRTHKGRVRHGIRSYTERINTPIQAAGADAIKMALVELYNRRRDIVLHVHDEIVVECMPNEADVIAEDMQTVMEQAAADALAEDVHVPAEPSVGRSWADKS